MPNHNSVWFLFFGSDSIIHVHVQYLVMTAGKNLRTVICESAAALNNFSRLFTSDEITVVF